MSCRQLASDVIDFARGASLYNFNADTSMLPAYDSSLQIPHVSTS